MQLKLHTVSLCFFNCGLLQVQSEERAFTRTFHMPWVCALWAIYTMNLQNDKSIGHAIQKIIICAKLRSNKATCIISGSRDSLHKVCTASDKILGCDLQLRLVVPCVAILFWKNINCSVSETLAKNFKAIRVRWNIPENVHQPWGFNKWVKIKCKEDSMSPTWQNYLCKKYAHCMLLGQKCTCQCCWEDQGWLQSWHHQHWPHGGQQQDWVYQATENVSQRYENNTV